jgi:hypothetical protein
LFGEEVWVSTLFLHQSQSLRACGKIKAAFVMSSMPVFRNIVLRLRHVPIGSFFKFGSPLDRFALLLLYDAWSSKASKAEGSRFPVFGASMKKGPLRIAVRCSRRFWISRRSAAVGGG